MSEMVVSENGNGADNIISLGGMYENYFLDYASYVILERAIPAIGDGLKPVQRRILYSMREKEDGRFHKVANLIGHTMQYHPHGDAAIGDALVNLGQKDLVIDCQGNWGDVRTGDRAAAARYIEARLTKFALDIAFNNQTTDWQFTYDGRKKEPVALPMKFPLLLAQGVEGIAVGLSTKILPHNFIELIQASIRALEGKRKSFYPDFPTGGIIDVGDYNAGKRGGKVKVRAKIEQVDKKTLAVREMPYGITTGTLIDSILKANDKGKIKIKKVVDNTAKDVEVLIELAPGVSPDLTIDALYAFSDCEISISTNACIIIDEKPHFVSVEDILLINTENTKKLLGLELAIKERELQEKLLFASLEKIFIENRIYHEIEECETWEAVMETIWRELKKYVATPGEKPASSDKRVRLYRDLTDDDIVRLTEIKIKRISKYNSFKADELIAKLEEELKQVKHDLEHLTEYAIAYFERLLQKYGKGKERRTEIASFDSIQRTQVVANNAKLYVNRKEGFIGMGLKKDEFVCDCSDIDEIIVFLKDGKFRVSVIADKVFVGKNIIDIGVWKKGDERTTYNMIYVDGQSGRSLGKRFNVRAITRDREYDLTKGTKGTKVHYFSTNPNGEAEVVNVQLTQGSSARKKLFDFDFSSLEIKGRAAKGNILTRYPIRKVSLKEAGKSTLGAMKIWMDSVSGRLNKAERGIFLGEFDTGDMLLTINKDGTYELLELELAKKFEPNKLVHIGKFNPESIISAMYYEGSKGWTMVKRFKIETRSLNQAFNFITDDPKSKLLFATIDEKPEVEYAWRVKNQKMEQKLLIADFIDVKGWKALGNKLIEYKVVSVKNLSEKKVEPKEEVQKQAKPVKKEESKAKAPIPKPKVAQKKEPKPKPEPKSTSPAKTDPDKDEKLHPGDSIDFDIEPDGQGKLF